MKQEGASSSFLLGLRVDRRAREGRVAATAGRCPERK